MLRGLNAHPALGPASRRPFHPLRVARGDDRSLRHVRVRDRDVLQLNGTDPLAPGLDHVLREIDHLHAAVKIDGRDVSGVEPAFGIGGPVLATVEVGAADPVASGPEAARPRLHPRCGYRSRTRRGPA